MTAMAPPMTAYLRQRLPGERAASRHTCETSASACQRRRHGASEQRSLPPSALPLEPLDAPLVLECLEYVQRVRGNAPRTRHARLTAITSFLHVVAQRVPSALEQINRVLAMPQHTPDQRLLDHLSAEQCQAILDNPTPNTRLAMRDRAMRHVRISAGWRVSELVALRLEAVSFEAPSLPLHVRGKGRKHRRLTLWRPVAESVRAWRRVRGEARVPELVLNAPGQEMTRAGCASL